MTRETRHFRTLAASARRQGQYLRFEGIHPDDHRSQELRHVARRARAAAESRRRVEVRQ